MIPSYYRVPMASMVWMEWMVLMAHLDHLGPKAARYMS